MFRMVTNDSYTDDGWSSDKGGEHTKAQLTSMLDLLFYSFH